MKPFIPILFSLVILSNWAWGQDTIKVKLFNEDELARQVTYSNIDQACRNYTKVYRLLLKGTGSYYGKVSAIPYQIDSLKYLQFLSITNEALDYLPPRVGKLIYLQQLYLSGNKFVSISDTIFSLKNLKRLDMQGNQLTKISDKIGRLTELEYLYLNDNRQLAFLPIEAILKLKKLKVLNCKNTKIPRPQLHKIQKLLPKTKVEF